MAVSGVYADYHSNINHHKPLRSRPRPVHHRHRDVFSAISLEFGHRMEARKPRLHLYCLPNEILMQLLSLFHSRALIPLATVSHRFHALVLRILHYRLLVATSLKDYKIILECFHPAFRLTEPHIFCKYLGTEGLSERHEGEGSLYENVPPAHQLGKLASLYSIFRPETTVEERANGSLLVPAAENEVDPNVLTVRRTITIADDEDFSRFCIVSSLVKVIPGSTSLQSAVTVKDCVIRLFRNWLRQKSQQSDDESSGNNSQLLWLDQGKNVGIKLRVRERRRPLPGFVNGNNTTAVSYDVYIEELHVRTPRILLALERSLHEQQNYKQAIIFTRSIA